MTLFEKSMKTLELPLILEQLAQRAGSEMGKERIRKLCPSTDIHEVRRLLDETSAAKKLIGIKGNLSFSGLKDVRLSVHRAERGGMLNTRELMDIGALLRTARMVQAYPEGDKPVNTCIDYLFNALHANKYFEEKIASSIVGEDEIADNASAELADIRRHIRVYCFPISNNLGNNTHLCIRIYRCQFSSPILLSCFVKTGFPMSQNCPPHH